MRIFLYLFVLGLGACAAQQPPKTAPHAPDGAAAAEPAPHTAGGAAAAGPAGGLSPQLQRARDLVGQKQYAQADDILRSLLAADEFRALDPAQRLLALRLGSVTALQVHDLQRSLSLIRRACEMPESSGEDWTVRVWAANSAREPREAAQALTVLAQHWPEKLSRLQEHGALDPALRALDKYGSDADRDIVLSALFTVYFATEPDSSSGWWRELALMQLGRSEQAAAVATLGRVTDPYVVISIEADKRFERIRSELESRLNVAEIARWSIESAAHRVRRNPDRLLPLIRLAALLADSLRFEESLRVVESAIDRQEAQGQSAYADSDALYATLLDYRAEALFNLGRFDAAIEQLKSASAPAPSGAPNIDQLIDLAGTYAQLGRPQEALATLKKLTPADGFGDLQAELVKLSALVQLHERKSSAASLRFLGEHRDEALGTYQEALLIAQRTDEGAALLISRLADPRLRSAALLAVQQYSAGAQSPWMLEQDRLWRALIERADVREAIARVGTVRAYPLRQPGY
jgi:tetratricopeptide (TPR) repeat protein